MTKMTFVGDGDSDPESVSLYGHTFPLGVAVEVTDPRVIGKLKTNANFRVGEAQAAAPVVKRKPGRPPKAVLSAPMKIQQLSDDELGPE